MARGTPDWVRMVQVVVTVDGVPTPPEPAVETPIIELDTLSTSSTSYGTVVSWTVTAGKVGVLKFIEMDTDFYTKTHWQLTIEGTVIFTDKALPASLSIELPDVQLAETTQVLLEAKSTDGTAIEASGDIVGKEVG